LYEAVGGRYNGFGDYDQGRTAVHEIGHYMGLLHPFEGSVCQNGYQVADLINDTRPEDVEHYYCPTSAISCGVQPNIRNYMNYTDDSCMQEFTREQANRMVCALLNYRPFLARAAFVFLPTVRK
jgi:hypothetical protein